MNKNTKYVIYVGMFSALCTVATFIKVPFGNGSMVHLGSAMIFTLSILFGGKYSGPAGAIGSAFFDLLLGFSPYTLWSFLIKGIAGALAGSISHYNGNKGKNLILNIFALIIASLWTLVGYIGAWTIVIGSYQAALLNIPSSLMSSAMGMIIALPLSMVLRKALSKSGHLDLDAQTYN